MPSNCALVNGVFVCGDGTASPDTLPKGCSIVAGVYTCTDGNTGSSGYTCVTNNATGEQTCLNDLGGTVTSSVKSLGRGLGSVIGSVTQHGSTGWLSRLTGWFAYAFNAFFGAIVQFLKDLVTYVLAVLLSVVVMMVQAIPVPDWIANNSMGSLLGQTGPIAGFFMTKLQIPAGLVLLGGGYAFRLLRKFLTLFQW